TIFPSLKYLIAFGFGTGLGLVIALIVFVVCYICDLEVKLQKLDANRLILQDLKNHAKEFKNIDQDSHDDDKDCPICLSEFKETDNVNQLSCHKSHIFHAACLSKMVYVKIEEGKESTCPTCRKPLALV
ncbi:hypothetical protein N9Y17_01820, partial [Gammaproteobacteria bacterium]|nr:hypothetical protein [Gammaproteobacteria bacterium]